MVSGEWFEGVLSSIDLIPTFVWGPYLIFPDCRAGSGTERDVR